MTRKSLRRLPRSIATLALVLWGFGAAAFGQTAFRVDPPEVPLTGNFARAQLLVTGLSGTGEDAVTERSPDLTPKATFASSDPNVVTVSATGQLLAAGNGQAEIAVSVDGVTHKVPVKVEGVTADPVISFSEQVAPILTKSGCNMGACHASQYGKGGLILSVFGFEPDKDRDALVRDERQRRVNFLEPEKSLLLQKPTMQVPHGGSRRLEAGSVDYQILAAWIAAGAPGPDKNAPKIKTVSVSPKQRIGAVGLEQQLRVEAEYTDGSIRDVTAWAKFDAMDDAVVSVSPSGRVTTVGKGQAPVMARFEGHAVISMFVVPYSDSTPLAGWVNQNFVDELSARKFRELGIEPSPICDDATFLRRAFLDATGTLPTPEETTAFLADSDLQKRTKMVDRLLGLTGDPALDIYNDRYAAWWTLKWSDLIRNESRTLGDQGMWALHNWIKDSFRTNKPFDRFVSELVTGKGSIFSNGPANYFRVNRDSSELAENTAQLFLGVRLQCAKCHHHPFEKYSQGDYYGFAAFFSRVGNKNSQEFGLFGRESVVMVRSTGDVRHPKTGQVLKPTALDGTEVDHPLDRRIPLAQWLTSKENAFFSRSIANRYMSYLLGRGLVEPVDDMRETNPPSNPALLDALAKHFVDSGYDSKQLIRAIMTSRLYQLSSQPTPENANDDRFYSHYRVKRMSAEALLDAIDSVTAVPTKFKDLPPGTRAIELPDAEYPDYFLKTFGKPKRASVCECERSPDENLAQALHTLNGDILAGKIANKDGRVAKLLAEKKSHEEIVNELYLATLNRPPTDPEMAATHSFLAASPSPKECYEDLLWALVNSKQFLFVR